MRQRDGGEKMEREREEGAEAGGGGGEGILSSMASTAYPERGSADARIG